MPRRIVGGVFVSLDGIVQAPGGPDEDRSGGFAHGGWFWPVDDDVVGEDTGKLFAADFDLLLGRRTYDIFAAYWPYQPTDNPIAAAFARSTKYVLTRSDTPLDWAESHRLADLGALSALKAGEGPDMVIQGSSTLYPQLLESGLLDRLVLMIAPITLGSGKRLFGDGTPPKTFKLVEQRATPRGWLIASYAPAGPLETGTLGPDLPSERELRRRERVNSGDW